MHIRKIIEGVTGTVRSAAAAISQRSSNLFAGPHEHHKVRRLAVVSTAAAVFIGTGATAAWAISNTDQPATEATSETAVVSEEPAAATEAPATTEEPAPATEAPAAEEPAVEAPAPEAATTEEKPAGPVDIDVSDIDDEQEANAVLIIEAGKDKGFDENGWAVALATAMQEAKLYNAASDDVPESWDYTDSDVHYEDHDSVGIMQQRPSMGWGSVEELMDVSTSAGKFYGTLDDVDGWEDMSVAEAAQAVQVSAYPDYYAQWEDLAWDIIDAYESAS